MTKKEPKIKVTLPEMDVELPRDGWNFYMSILNGIGIRNATPIIQGDIEWLYGDFLADLPDSGEVLGSVIKSHSQNFKKNPTPYLTGLDKQKPKKKSRKGVKA